MYTPLENAPQGSAAWLAARSKHFCASEAAAALGLSKYTTRDELLRQKATGLTEEVSPAKQRIFDAGHEAEALARPIAEGIAGTEFFPVVATREVDGLPLLASFDGIDLLDDLIWENKLLNQSLLQQVQASDLEPHYWLQLEHQLLVSGASRALFTTSDGTPGGTHPLWYESKPERRAQLIAGWKQFAADLAAWVPPEAAPAPVVASPMETLPAVSLRVDGQIAIVSNLPAYGALLREFVERIPAEPSTDQEFADTEAACKRLKRVEDELESAEEHALAQFSDVNVVRQLMKEYRELARTTRLQREKLVSLKKDQIRGEIVAGGITALREHIAGLNAAMPAPYMPQVPADFAGAIKGKRTVDSLRSAVNDELARAKIEASNIAARIHANVKTLEASGLVVPDAATLVLKAPDDLAAIIAPRKAAEQQRLEAERERIRQEEAARADREARAKLEAEQQAVLIVEPKSTMAEECARPAENAANVPLIRGEVGVVNAGLRIASPPAPAARTSYCCEKGEQQGLVDKACDDCAEVSAGYQAAMFAPKVRTSVPTLRIGTIKERLQHMSVTAEDLRALGFEPAGRERAAPLYHEDDFPAICEAIAAQALAAKAQFLRDLAVVAA